MVSKLAGVISSSFISESLSKLEGTIVADRRRRRWRKGAYCKSRMSSNISLVGNSCASITPKFPSTSSRDIVGDYVEQLDVVGPPPLFTLLI